MFAVIAQVLPLLTTNCRAAGMNTQSIVYIASLYSIYFSQLITGGGEGCVVVVVVIGSPSDLTSFFPKRRHHFVTFLAIKTTKYPVRGTPRDSC